MVSTPSCFLLFGIVILTNGERNYYKEKSKDLIQELSNLKAKHGLNFVNIEGTKSLLKTFKKSHPNIHYIEPGDPQHKQGDNPSERNIMKHFNSLVAMNKFKAGPIHLKHQSLRMKSLRICRKERKQEKEMCVPKEKIEKKKSKETKEECDSNNHNKNKEEKKLYYRAGNNKKHFTVDETANLLIDLEKVLAKNGKYNIFLGCVGDMCGGRSNRDRYVEERDNTEAEREYLGCTGGRCGGNRDDDDETDVRRRY